ncbi:MAG: ABC transporter substrate-binding protein [Elusimicrobiota bacterium]|nr:ABC transporter substrate-binding protein [Elusimicrobiota bacterium]
MKKILLALIPLLVFGLIACSKSSKNQKTVYLLNFKPEVADVYNKIAKAYEAETGVRLRVATAASGTYEQTFKAEAAKSNPPTIFQINGPRGWANAKDYTADLKNTELYSHLSDKSLAISVNGNVYGIPYTIEGYGIIYNDAIVQKYFALPNRATRFNSMDDVNSFAELKALVEDMQRHKNDLGIKGVFAATSLQPGEDWRWQTHLANVPMFYEFRDNNVDLSQPVDKVTFKYSQNFKQIFDLYLNNSTTDPKLLGSKQVSDSMAEFALGEAAMVQNGNWAWSQINGISGNVVKAEDIKFLPIYIGVNGENKQGLCIGTENYFSINSQVSPEDQQLAADFLLWLFSSPTGKKFVTNDLGFITPFDTFSDDEKPTDPLAREVIAWMAKPNIYSVSWVFVVFPSQVFKNDFGAALLSYAQGQKTWDQVKSVFVTEWAVEAAHADQATAAK